MAAKRILQLGDPLLRETSAPMDPAADRGVFDDLRDTLHEFQRTHGFGRGISAVQIGALVRAIYIEFEGQAYCIANPHFEWMSGETFEMWDDCFSFPDLLVRLRRSTSVRLLYQDVSGQYRVLEASGALSELLQHELDHLDGILAVDRAIDKNSLCTREEYQRRHQRHERTENAITGSAG
jgi:peptide deformylase